MKPVKTIQKEFSSFKQFIAYIKAHSQKDNLVWLGDYVFGGGFIQVFKRPSDIPYTAIGRYGWPNGTEGYYRQGRRNDFPGRIRIKYDNSCLTCE